MKHRKMTAWTLSCLLGGAALQLILGWLTDCWMNWTGWAPPPAVTLSGNAAEWFLRTGALVLLVPVAEEALFRGFIYGGLRKRMPSWGAGIVTAVLFAAAHRSLSGVPAYVVFGLCAWSVRERSGSWGYCAVLHGAYNACALVLSMLKAFPG